MIDQTTRGSNHLVANFQDCQNQDRARMSIRRTSMGSSLNLQETSDQNTTLLAVAGSLEHREKETTMAPKVERAGGCQTELQEEGSSEKVCR